MPGLIKTYVRVVDRISLWTGRVSLYLVFVIMAVLLIASLSRLFMERPILWGVEMAQFTMVIYFTVGGAFALLLNSHVRMDILYSRWSPRKKAGMDTFTFFFLIVYLGLLMYGCVSSTAYSIQYHQHNNTPWAPPIAPVKILIGTGIFLTILQAFSEFFKDMARTRGIELEAPIPEKILLEESSESKSGPEAPATAPEGLPVPALEPVSVPAPAAAAA
ncbi:MAG: TRAP transporter small permease subunit [Deltaproteobacteria bacterium]|jgi:TRAP-type mannitol/chloroaromatic compound transport system permease small subunit|nr:TRAP transporter small permease subunit [Deltaproteobacteria bacterium]